jgi:hypothetical protein
MIDNSKIAFYFCKMFENVQFFSHLISKFAKCANMIPNSFSQKVETDIKCRSREPWTELPWDGSFVSSTVAGYSSSLGSNPDIP